MGNLIIFIVRFYLSVWFLLTLSAVLYICLYNWFIPNYSMTEAIFFRHDVSCKQLTVYQKETNADNQLQNYDEHNVQQCQHTNYDVPNMKYKNFFKSGHVYHFELQLLMPDSIVNRNLGMFMIWIRFYDYDGTQIFHVVRPALYPYTSTLLSLAKLICFFPFYLIGYYSETHTIMLKLLDEHVDVHDLDFSQIHRIRLEIETLKPIEIIPPSKLTISVNLKGIQYMMYFWPITSSILIIGFIFTIFFMIYLCSILRQPMKTKLEPAQNDNRYEEYFTEANTCVDQLFDDTSTPTSTT